MKTVFVVLHYCQIEVTQACVQSLLELEGSKEIVIVDNASPDGSGVILRELFKDEKLIHVLLNETNEGFASGNNKGYHFAKAELNPDVVAVINNDTIIEDKEFLVRLGSLSSLSLCHIIAPDILTYKGIHQNPHREKGKSLEWYRSMYKRKKLGKLFYSIPLLYRIRKLDNELENERVFIDERKEGIVPHGAAVLYTKNWIERENFAFYPGTFMYYEEDLLYWYALKRDYIIVYEPSLQIRHMEDMSTNSTHRDVRKRMLFQTTQKLKSIKVIIDYLASDSNQ